RRFLDQYCSGCHNSRLKTAGLAFEALDVDQPATEAETWEKVVRELRTRMMPPQGARRPPQPIADGFVATLEHSLDRTDAVRPNPGRPGIHRLNRVEYTNAVRDLLDFEVNG